MRAGSLRHSITIQTESNTQNDYGETSGAWPEFLTTRASINPLRGKDYMEAQQSQSEVRHKVIIRYHAGVKPSMRVKFGERIFEILDVINPEERNLELHLMCKELMK